MQIVTQNEFRTRWARVRDAAKIENDVIVVSARYIGPVVVLLGPARWREGVEVLPPAEEPARLGAREARIELKRVTEDARRGRHTIITEHNDEDSVVVPIAWVRQALPDALIGLEEALEALEGAT